MADCLVADLARLARFFPHTRTRRMTATQINHLCNLCYFVVAVYVPIFQGYCWMYCDHEHSSGCCWFRWHSKMTGIGLEDKFFLWLFGRGNCENLSKLRASTLTAGIKSRPIWSKNWTTDKFTALRCESRIQKIISLQWSRNRHSLSTFYSSQNSIRIWVGNEIEAGEQVLSRPTRPPFAPSWNAKQTHSFFGNASMKYYSKHAYVPAGFPACLASCPYWSERPTFFFVCKKYWKV